MRKLLLASAAMLGAVSAGAQAQQATQGQIAAPYFAGPAIQSLANSGQALAGYQGQKFFANTAPTPGTMVVRLNGRVQNWVQATNSTNNNTATGVSGGNFKTNAISFGSYIRLYPGVDAMAANGLRYGAAVEIRQQLTGQVSTAGAASGLGGGTTAAPGLGASQNNPAGALAGLTLQVNKAFAYFAHDNFGLVRLGQGDGLAQLWDVSYFASGAAWDGGFGSLNGAGALSFGANGAFAVPYTLAATGADYTNPKIVYLSPQFLGFDVGFQYAPGMNQTAGCNSASAVCSTTTSGSDPTRWYNQIAVGARYQGSFGPVAASLHGFWERASKEQFNNTPIASGGPGRVSGSRYDDLNFILLAGSLAYTSPVGVFAIGATYITGDINGQLIMKPSGGAKEDQIVGGVQYRNGPLSLGVQVNKTMSQGSVNLVGISQRNEFAIAAGGNYVIAPGVSIFAEYVYAQRHQGGFNFVTGASAAGTATRDGKGQALVLGTAIGW